MAAYSVNHFAEVVDVRLTLEIEVTRKRDGLEIRSGIYYLAQPQSIAQRTFA